MTDLLIMLGLVSLALLAALYLLGILFLRWALRDDPAIHSSRDSGRMDSP